MATQRIPHLILILGLLLVPFLFSGCIIEGCDCEDEIAATYGHYGEPEEMESNREDNEYEMTLRYIALGFEKVFTWGDEMERCCYEDTKTITDDDDGDNDDGSLSLAISTAELTNDNDADGEIGSGDTVTYTVTATNTSDEDQDNVEVSVTEPTTDSETCATVAQDETCVLDYSYTVTQSDVDAGSIEVKAEAESDQVTTPVTDTETTSLSGNGGGDAEFELSLEIKDEKLIEDTGGDGVAQAGEKVAFTVAAENTGTAAQSDVIITATGPTGTTTPQDYTCATLASGDTCSQTFEYELTDQDIQDEKITVEAEAVSNEVATVYEDIPITLANLTTADQSLIPEVNFPPLPISQKVYPQLVEPKEIELSAIDPNGDPMTFKIKTPPSNGTLNPAYESEMGIFVYTPSLYAGDQTEDSFTFVANDGALDSKEATVKIIIGNQPPKAVDTTIELLVDPGNEVLLQMRGSDLNGDLLIYELMNTSGITSGALKIDQFNAEYGTIPYVLGKGTYEVEFTFKVIDSEGAESGVGTVTISVNEPEAEV